MSAIAWIVVVTVTILALLGFVYIGSRRDDDPDFQAAVVRGDYSLRRKLATRPRHRIPRHDRGEAAFWGDYETGTEGNLHVIEPDLCLCCGAPAAADLKWCQQCIDDVNAEYGPENFLPPLKPLPDGYQLGDLRTWNPANVPDPVPTGAQSSAGSGTTTDHWDDTTSVDLLPPIRDDLAGCVNVDRYIDRLFSMVDVPRIFQMAGAR